MIETLDATSSPSTGWFAAAQRRREVIFGVLALLGSLAFVGLVLLLQVMSAVWVFVFLLLLAVLWRPKVGLLSAFVLVTLLEDGGLDKVMEPGRYLYAGLGQHIGVKGLLPSPLEVLVFGTLLIWLIKGLVRHHLDFRGGEFRVHMLFFIGALVFGALRGLAGGAPLKEFTWELRFIATIPVCYFLTTNLLRSPRDLRLLLSLSLVAGTIFGLAGLYRRIALVDTGIIDVPMESVFAHESVIFWGFVILLVFAQQVFGGAPAWQRVMGAIAIPVAGFAILGSERRAGQMGMIIAFMILSMVLFFAKRRAFFIVCLPLILIFMAYLPLFWNNTSVLGQPARAVRSLYQPDPRDASSNLYRDIEKLNIHATLRAGTLFGVGFGRPFLIVVQLVDVSSFWPLWRLQPHNNIMWVWLKLGPAGFIVFWTLFGSALMRAAFLAKTRPEKDVRIIVFTVIGGIVISLVYCYVDLALTGPRLPLILGTLLGVLGTVEQVYPANAPQTQRSSLPA